MVDPQAKVPGCLSICIATRISPPGVVENVNAVDAQGKVPVQPLGDVGMAVAHCGTDSHVLLQQKKPHREERIGDWKHVDVKIHGTDPDPAQKKHPTLEGFRVLGFREYPKP
jgi:hypothetical protein